jgi:hypothetical protein
MLGNAELMESGLVSVLENRPAACEVLLVLNGPYDNSYELDDEVRFVAAPRGAGWAESCNLGIREAQADVVHLLMPGVEATPGWADTTLAHFESPDVAAVAPLVLDRRRSQRIISAGVGYRRGRHLVGGRYRADGGAARLASTTVVGPSCLAGFYRKSHVVALGGFEPAVGDELADVDLALRAAQAGLRMVIEPQSILCAAPPRSAPGGFRRGLCTERLLLRSADSLGSLAVARPLAWLVGLALRMFHPPRALAHAAGQLAAWCELPRHLRYRGSLQRLSQALSSEQAPLLGGDARLDAPHAHAPSLTRGPLRVSA